jgi:hypothetical protein
MSEDWIHESQERGEFLNQKDFLIGGSQKAKKTLKRDFTDPDEEDKKASQKEQMLIEKKSKYILKVSFNIFLRYHEGIIQYILKVS